MRWKPVKTIVWVTMHLNLTLHIILFSSFHVSHWLRRRCVYVLYSENDSSLTFFLLEQMYYILFFFILQKFTPLC